MEYISPVGRLVQGSFSLQEKKDPQSNKAILDPETGKPVMEVFFAMAVPKQVRDPASGQMIDNPELLQFYSLFVQQAQADFPHLFVNGVCQHPKFAWKIQDGDGRDGNGVSVADKPGFAGHYVFKFGTRYVPKCFHYGKYDASQQIQNPDEVIKRGYYIRVGGTIAGNGVKPDERMAVPGLYLSPNLVELIAFGDEIVGGADPNKVFGAAPINQASLPPGASLTPRLPAGGAQGAPGGLPGQGGGLTPPPLPGQGGLGAPNAAVAGGLPGMGGGAPALGAPAGGLGAPPLPGGLGAPPVQQGPQYTMTPTAGGVTFEEALRQGWTPEALVANGHATKNW